MKFLSKVVKNDPKDRLEIELGDTKEPSVFFPQLKIKRWDNEVNASFRLKDFDNFSISSDKGKIKLVNGKKEVHLYPIEPCEEHPEGGFEFEVILKEKPASNVLEFSVETKGLDFFYQPALNQKEIDEGANRPESVVGSYAVYHKTKGGLNIVGGKEYKVGKAFHIFRPKIIDAEGNWIWGKLHIDVEKKLQTITIPQEFLDNAVYPVRHAAGETFGYTSIGVQNSQSGYNIFAEFTSPAETGNITTISVYLNNASGEDQGAAVYDDDGLPNNLLANESSYVGGTNGDWVDVPVSYSFSASTDYWLGNTAEALRTYYYDTGGGNFARINMGALTWENPQSTAPAETNSNRYSIYATYTPSGAGARRYYSPGIWRTV